MALFQNAAMTLTYRDLRKFLDKIPRYPTYDMWDQSVTIYDPINDEYYPIDKVWVEEDTDVLDCPHIVLGIGEEYGEEGMEEEGMEEDKG